jgi:hypothetical protein
VSAQPDFATTPRPSGWRARDRVLVVLAGLAVAFVAVAAWSARREARQASERLAEVRKQTVDLRQRLSALASRSRQQPGAADGASSPARIVAALASLLPGDVRLRHLSINYARGTTLRMQVEARSAAAWDRMLDRLEHSPEFRDVTSGPEAREAEVRTTIDARWAGDARR